MDIKAFAKKRNRRLKEPFIRRAKAVFLRSLWNLFVFSILPVAVLGGHWLYTELVSAEFLEIRTVDVSGGERVKAEDLISASGIRPGQNILSFSAGNAEVSLRMNPWVRTARVTRRLPDTVKIDVVERVPIALVKLDGLFVMDSEGVIFKRLSNADAVDLPIVTGFSAEVMRESQAGGGLESGLIDLLGALSRRSGFNSRQVSEIRIDPVYGFFIYTLSEGIRIGMGKGNFEEKLSAFEKIAHSRGGVLTGMEAVDLTKDNEAIVKLTGNAYNVKGAL